MEEIINKLIEDDFLNEKLAVNGYKSYRNADDVRKNFIVIPDRKTAIDAAINFANRDDIVVIAGRGHEKFQLFSNGKKIKFNDYEVAGEIIENLKRSMKK